MSMMKRAAILVLSSVFLVSLSYGAERDATPPGQVLPTLASAAPAGGATLSFAVGKDLACTNKGTPFTQPRAGLWPGDCTQACTLDSECPQQNVCQVVCVSGPNGGCCSCLF